MGCVLQKSLRFNQVAYGQPRGFVGYRREKDRNGWTGWDGMGWMEASAGSDAQYVIEEVDDKTNMRA